MKNRKVNEIIKISKIYSCFNMSSAGLFRLACDKILQLLTFRTFLLLISIIFISVYFQLMAPPNKMMN